jgi:hypothetical protein
MGAAARSRRARYTNGMRRLLAAGAALATLALRATAVEPAPATPTPGPPDARGETAGRPAETARRADVRTIAGKIAALDAARRELTLAAADGPLRVTLDRNTMVLLESRLGSVRDLAVGVPARVSVSGAENLAAYVELRPRGVVPTASTGEPPAGG